MYRSSLLLLTAILILLLFGCTEKITNSYVNENYGDPFDARVLATVHGIVTAQGTGSPVANVRVSYVINGDTRYTYTNNEGYYRCEYLSVGTYQLSYQPTDSNYATMISALVVNHDSAFARPSRRDIYITYLRNITIVRNNATVEGYVNLRPNNDTTFFASGAEVSIIFQTDLLNNVSRTTMLNSNGFYRFTNLPAVGYGVSVRVEGRQVNGVRFGTAVSGNFNLLYNDTVMAPNIVQVPEVLTPLIVINSSFLNRGAIPPNTVLMLDFNRPIADLGQVLTDISQVPNVPMPTAIVVENNNTRLRIVSTLTAATIYRLNVRVRGVEDYTVFSQTYTFGTTP